MKIVSNELHPTFNNVALQTDKEEGTTESGFILPDQDDLPTVGRVIAVGPGKTNERGEIIPMKLCIGDHVIFSAHAGKEVPRHELHVEGQLLLVMKETEILAIIEEDE